MICGRCLSSAAPRRLRGLVERQSHRLKTHPSSRTEHLRTARFDVVPHGSRKLKRTPSGMDAPALTARVMTSLRSSTTRQSACLHRRLPGPPGKREKMVAHVEKRHLVLLSSPCGRLADRRRNRAVEAQRLVDVCYPPRRCGSVPPSWFSCFAS